MHRLVQPEWLDELPPGDPAATGSRRDLQRLNRVMGHVNIMAGLLDSANATIAPLRIVELGAGDGTCLLQLARRLSPRWTPAQAVLVDRSGSVSAETKAEFAALGWTVELVISDVFDWLRKADGEPMDVMIANLFLHHFQAPQLAELLALAAGRTRRFFACEPRRSRMALLFSHLVGVIGCNAVTRHDAVVSVRAGFAGRELSALWPQEKVWRVDERSAGLFTHAFLAQRGVAS